MSGRGSETEVSPSTVGVRGPFGTRLRAALVGEVVLGLGVDQHSAFGCSRAAPDQIGPVDEVAVEHSATAGVVIVVHEHCSHCSHPTAALAAAAAAAAAAALATAASIVHVEPDAGQSPEEHLSGSVIGDGQNGSVAVALVATASNHSQLGEIDVHVFVVDDHHRAGHFANATQKRQA